MKEIKRIVERTDLRYWRFFCINLALAAALAVFEVLLMKTTGDISQAAVDFSVADIRHILLVMAGLTGGKLLISALYTLQQYWMDGRAVYQLRRFFADFLLRIGFKGLSQRSGGDMLSLYSRDLPQAAELLTQDTLYPLLTYLQVRISGPVQTLSVEASQKSGAFNAVVNDSLQNTALVRKAPVLVLDEATAALDSQSERGIMETVRALRGRYTILMVTHNLEQVTGADEIVVLKEGKIAERGTNPALLAARGEYARLWERRESAEVQ